MKTNTVPPELRTDKEVLNQLDALAKLLSKKPNYITYVNQIDVFSNNHKNYFVTKE